MINIENTQFLRSGEIYNDFNSAKNALQTYANSLSVSQVLDGKPIIARYHGSQNEVFSIIGTFYKKIENNNTITGITFESALDRVAQSGLPAVTAADNTKILQVVNGVWTLVTPNTVYTGTDAPLSSLGNDGDIYLQTS